MTSRIQFLLSVLVATASSAVDALPPEVSQLIISVAPGWDAPRGKLALFERSDDGIWRQVNEAVPVAFGKHGLAWGRGVLSAASDAEAPRKVEGDLRAPAGVFALGKVFGDAPMPPEGTALPYHQVTARDAWVEDPSLPEYNRHVVLAPGEPEPSWFERERMKLGDPAFRWRVEIRHNADPPEPGAGSAIFFHIRRGAHRLTAGCTTMSESDLVTMIRWLRPERQPHYVLLPWNEYARRQEDWRLPPVEQLAALAPES